MKAAVFNLSHPHYNLGAEKLANWLRSQKWTVTRFAEDIPTGLLIRSMGFDLVCLSAIFTWDVLKGVEIAQHAGCEVWAGGPAYLYMADWWKRETGLSATVGLDERFEWQRGDYRMTYAARGCPWDCHFCGVTKIEGKEYRMDWEFQPAPILCDNNLTDEPVQFQKFIIARYFQEGVPLLDANSGFEPRNFTEETYRRWKPILRGPWRCGYDYMPERSSAKRMLEILKEEPAKRKRVYVLIGNEPFQDCLQRAQEVIQWGGEPHCQPLLRKTAMFKRDYEIRHDWTPVKLTHFARYFNRFTWRSAPLSAYECRGKRPFQILEASA